ncbi:2574_t:CDS:2, partial [Funneliformis caledonium]
MMMPLDPAFSIPSNKRIKNEIYTGYTNAIKELKILLENTCEFTSLTTNLWIAKSKHRIFYATLSIIYPLIQVLKFKYAENGENNNEDSEIEQ